ncbi:MAG: DUF4097 domain-containing protein [Actinomycetota bacterium]|nr:DUF4097 domain-containing protein [Actinomycetota bacterium]
MEPTTYDTPGEVRLEVRIPSGDVRVRTADTAQTTVHVTGERDPGDVEVVFEPGVTGHHVLRIQQRRKNRAGWRSGRSLTVEVTAPERTTVRVEGGSTDLSVDGPVDAVWFACGAGDATVGDVTGDFDAKVASGDLRVGRVAGSATVHSASGDIDLAAADGGLVVRTASGDIRVATAQGELRITTLSGDVLLGHVASGNVNVQAVSGDVNVGVAAGTSVYLDLASVSGDTSSDLPVSDVPADGAGPRLDIRAHTVSGDVRVRRAAHSDAA